MDPLEVGAVHQAMPQGIIEHGAQTVEQVHRGTDRPLTNDQRKAHMRLGEVIPVGPVQGGTGCGKMDDISPSPTVGPALSRPGANKKKEVIPVTGDMRAQGGVMWVKGETLTAIRIAGMHRIQIL